MNPELKQRLVGAAVLFFLAGLLWVLLFDFDTPELELTPPVTIIPAMPIIEAVVVEPATPFYDDSSSGPSTPLDLASTAVVPVTKNSKHTVPSAELSVLLGDAPLPKPIANKHRYVDQDDRPRLDAEGVPISYVLQLGSFNRFNNADKLRHQLINEYQFRAYVMPKVEMGDGPYKVLVGPVLTYAEVKRLAVKVKQVANVTDIIIKRFGDTQ